MRAAIHSGDRVLDGTAGNGHDTTFLAECVGESGKVVAFDIQAEAITHASARLEAASVKHRVELVLQRHEYLGKWLDNHWPGESLAGAMFNLGYRPGGSKDLVTQAETTISALEQTIARLRPAGLLTVVLYTGHAGGRNEADAVIDWAKSLDPAHAVVLWYQFLNPHNSPSLLAIRKSG